ncbi:hypothetical protein [Desulfuromonas thiophila]|uniref:Uncharacterized protein n=1 Tax=Desulfuromonas thiophila TaxID=57664 RepID=A0A1G7ECQ4_9BACT|nr:hypothetical protein [Desulfuromonas thiophila]SDE61392.1 hypothetical protein SAMN05661003_11931 [Desulfuromonas thiophila]
MIPHLHFLEDDLTVTPADDGRVQISVVLPSDSILEYIHLLDALTGFFRLAQRHGKLVSSLHNAAKDELRKRCEENRQRYFQRIVKAFDLYSAKGLDRNAAIKQISVDLYAEKHPWASVDLVRPALIEAGRPGRIGRPRRNP